MRRVILYVLYAVVVIGLITSIVLAFHQKSTSPKPKPETTAQQEQQKPQEKPKSESKPQNNTSNKPSNSNQQTAQNPTPGSASQQSNPSFTAPSAPSPSTPSAGTPTAGKGGVEQPLTNTGPGEVVALFAGSALVGTVAYSLHQRRKLA